MLPPNLVLKSFEGFYVFISIILQRAGNTPKDADISLESSAEGHTQIFWKERDEKGRKQGTPPFITPPPNASVQCHVKWQSDPRASPRVAGRWTPPVDTGSPLREVQPCRGSDVGAFHLRGLGAWFHSHGALPSHTHNTLYPTLHARSAFWGGHRSLEPRGVGPTATTARG